MTQTGHPGYDQLLEDFGRALNAGAARHAAARRRRHLGAAGLVLACIGVGLLALIGAGPRAQLDLNAQARAALAPAGQIVHLVTTTHIETKGRPGVGATTTSEQWSASDPPRWRVAFDIPTPTTTPGGKPVGNLDGLLTGPMQLAYGGGAEEFYAQQPNTLEVTTGLREDGSHAAPRGPLGVEPIATVRSMLAARKLHDAGSATVNGRPVRRLVGKEPRGSNPPWSIEYDVAPRTDAPVRVRIEAPRAAQPAGIGVPVILLDVNSYQRLPLNGNTAVLLRIQPTGNPTVQHRRASAVRHPRASTVQRRRADG
jgi:hypothetical protein